MTKKKALFLVLVLLGLLSVELVHAFDTHEKCNSAGLYPIPNMTCSNPCGSVMCGRLSVTTNNGHSGTTCDCTAASGVECCKIAYCAGIMDYEVVGDCMGSSCTASHCKLVTINDPSGKPPPPILKYGECQ